MAQPAFDDSIEKLEGFCELLAKTSAVLIRDGEILDARGDSLDKHETEARTTCEKAAEQLATAVDDVTDVLDEAVDEAEQLAVAAQEIASARVSAAEDGVDAAGTDFEQRTGEDRSELEKAFLGLFESGFAALAAAMDEMDTELARAGEAARQSLDVLEQGASDVGQQAAADGAETVAALKEAERAVAEEDAELEQQGAEYSDLWTDELPELVRAECASVAEPLEALYREWEAEVVAEGDELSEGVAGLLEDAADIVTNEAGQPLATAVEEAVENSCAAVSGQQDGLMTVLDEGETAGEAAASLVDDLVIARRLVGEIERLLNAIAE